MSLRRMLRELTTRENFCCRCQDGPDIINPLFFEVKVWYLVDRSSRWIDKMKVSFYSLAFLPLAKAICNQEKLDDIEEYYGNGILRDVSDKDNPVCSCVDKGSAGYDVVCQAVNENDGRFCDRFYPDITDVFVFESSCGLVTFTHSFDANDIYLSFQEETLMEDEDGVIRDLSFYSKTLFCETTSAPIFCSGTDAREDCDAVACGCEIRLDETDCTCDLCPDESENTPNRAAECTIGGSAEVYTRTTCDLEQDTGFQVLRRLLNYISNTRYEWLLDSSELSSPSPPPPTPASPTPPPPTTPSEPTSQAPVNNGSSSIRHHGILKTFVGCLSALFVIHVL